jgi:hypothetical protein
MNIFWFLCITFVVGCSTGAIEGTNNNNSDAGVDSGNNKTDVPAVCGNEECEDGETCSTCEVDCGPCSSGGEGGGCTGDAMCDVDFCQSDCPCLEGQGDCDSNQECEAGLVCSWESGSSYGCDPSSELDICLPLSQASDYCGDGNCDDSGDQDEDESNCPEDCVATNPCGNQECDNGETCSSCPADCGPCGSCNNDTNCDADENCGSCPDDCGLCLADMYEPFEHVAPPIDERSSGELDDSCFSRDFGDWHERAMCLAVTRPVTDLISETTTDYARSGQRSMHFRMIPTPFDDWPSSTEPTHRNELTPWGWDKYPDLSEERWYGFSVMFPNDFVFAPDDIANSIRFLFAQWQHGTAGSPSVSIEVIGDKFRLELNGGTAPDDIHGIDSPLIGTIERGRWIDFVLRVFWDQSDGLVEVWIDGVKVYEKYNIQTIYYNKDNGGKLKVGVYYWRWKSQSDVQASLDAGITNRELYYDEIREYFGTNGYDIVKPR